MAKSNGAIDIVNVREIQSTPAEISEWRHERKTRFLVDENIKPWAIHLMKRNKVDLLEVRGLGLAGRDDQKIFALCWKLRRFLITHDTDFLDDNHFPYNRCAGLMVLPEFSRQTSEFRDLITRAIIGVRKGADFWFQTKIEVSLDYVLTIRRWEKSEGSVNVSRVRIG